jgi:hypothetical protein
MASDDYDWRRFAGLLLDEAFDRLDDREWRTLFYFWRFRRRYIGPLSGGGEFRNSHPFLLLLEQLGRSDGALVAVAFRDDGRGHIAPHPEIVPYVFWTEYNLRIRRSPLAVVTDGVRGGFTRYLDPRLFLRHAKVAAHRETAQQRMRAAYEELKLDQSLSLKEQHDVILQHLGVKPGTKRYTYENFLKAIKPT